MKNIKIMRADDQPMISEGKAMDCIFTAFRRLNDESDGRVILLNGMVCDFFKLPSGGHSGVLMNPNMQVVALAEVDEMDR